MSTTEPTTTMLTDRHLMADPARFLKDLLIDRKSKNASYSTRALARDLGLSPAFLSQVMNGKRNLSLEQKVKVRALLGLRGSLTAKRKASDASDGGSAFELIEQTIEHEKIIRYWYHFAILEMCQIEKLPHSAEVVASRLGLSELEIELAIERLIHFGYIKSEKGVLVRTKTLFMFNTKKSSPALREYHQARLGAAQDELKNFDQESVDRRYFQTLFVPTSAKKIAQARERIGEFQKRLIEFLKEESPDEVFQLSLQLFSVEARRRRSS
ncbi:MAG: DUF4423 domain-containing protein [Bdellovibrionales bacterium]|nr:DUF4423 domain-containing protein [Bdellovibrionales bacterium]